jgi:autotransporter-associated beta strand protein
MKTMKTLLLNLCLLLGLLAVPKALAQSTDTWIGTAGDGSVNDTVNWSFSSGAGPVASGDSLVFGVGVNTTVITNDLAGLTFASLTYNEGASAYTNWGNAFTLGTNTTVTAIAVNSANSQVFSNNIVLSTNLQAIALTGAGNLTLAGHLTGAGGLAFSGSGSGALTLTTSNTFTGGTIVNSGVLNLDCPGAGLPTLIGTLTINPGAQVNTVAADALGYDVGASDELTNIYILGGTLNNGYTGNNGFTTIFNLMGGTVSSTGGGFNFNLGYNINTLATNNSSLITAPVVIRSTYLTNNVALGTVPNGIDLLVSGIISGSGEALVKAGAGTEVLTATNTYTGATIISAGSLTISGAGELGGGQQQLDHAHGLEQQSHHPRQFQ